MHELDLLTCAKRLSVAALILAIASPLLAFGEEPARTCNVSIDTIRFSKPLPRVAHKLAIGGAITIVAIGSSSTAGAGATTPAMNYPNRLALELTHHFGSHSITVINRGVNGEEIDDMFKRFDSDVIAIRPDLVLWQLGTNSIIRDQRLADHDTLVHRGLKKIRAIGADVVLIDPQFAPQIILRRGFKSEVQLIAEIAKQEDVNLFHRFALMKRWNDVDHIAFESFISPDGLHMNDWGYGCMAKGLAIAIDEAARRPVISATQRATH